MAESKTRAAVKTDAPIPEELEANTAPDPEELVTVELFRDNEKYKDDVFVSVNGERVQIKRGVPVQIKRKFAEVLEHSHAQDMATARMIERESAQYKAEATARNV